MISRIYEKINMPIFCRPLVAALLCSYFAFQSFPQTISHGFQCSNQILSGQMPLSMICKFFIFTFSSVSLSSASQVLGKLQL